MPPTLICYCDSMRRLQAAAAADTASTCKDWVRMRGIGRGRKEKGTGLQDSYVGKKPVLITDLIDKIKFDEIGI